MLRTRPNSTGARWLANVLVGVMLSTGFTGAVFAQESIYVTRDGREIVLQKSEFELGVVFRAGADINAGRQRLEASGRGKVEDIKYARGSRIKLLKVEQGLAVRRGVVAQDRDVQHVGSVYRFASAKTPVVTTGSVVARVRSDLDAGALAQLWSDYGVDVIEVVDGLHDVYVVQSAGRVGDGVNKAYEMAKDARTHWAQPNFWRLPRTRQVAPSDQFFQEQWHLNNTGQRGGEPDADIDAPEAWLIAEGQDVLIGMLDDACDVDHPDLRDNYKGIGHDPSLDSQDVGFDDPRPKQIFDRHGTAVMGLAVASANNLGGRGVAYLSRFTVSRGLEQLTDVEIARAYTFARQQKVDVHINSWGIDGPDPAIVVDAIQTAFREGRDLDGEAGDDPPLGMVIVFAAGNDGVENVRGLELSTLPDVIGVGASNDRDERALFSNFGPDMNFLAPGGDNFGSQLFTTDNEDVDTPESSGYNFFGFNTDSFDIEVDSTGDYTGFFGGTSAACPIAAGVAALTLSVNKQLSATDVRLIMEHTCDRVDGAAAQYNGITSRSLTHGYGRINAKSAVDKAVDSLTNGGRTWPDIPTNVKVVDTDLLWDTAVGTDDFLLLESDTDFPFIPQDGICYDRGQLGCGGVEPRQLPAGVSVNSTGCSAGCAVGDTESAAFVDAGATKFFALYARSSIGRYSFGVAIDSQGTDTGGGGGSSTLAQRPSVTLSANPRDGVSPLNVQFNGNSVSDIEIDNSRTQWDFNKDDSTLVDARTAAATHTYEVPPGETRTFTAKLTMYDIEGNAGNATVQIRVVGPGVDEGGALGTNQFRIVVGIPGTTGSDESQGRSPFAVELSIDAESLTGVLETVVWDLGDGTRQTSLVVPHTYINQSELTLVVPITATVTTVTSGGTTLISNSTRLVAILPGDPEVDTEPPPLPGTGTSGAGGAANPCGTVGLIPMLFGVFSLFWFRRRMY